jgi:hypothetical protein
MHDVMVMHKRKGTSKSIRGMILGRYTVLERYQSGTAVMRYGTSSGTVSGTTAPGTAGVPQLAIWVSFGADSERYPGRYL